MVGAGFPRLGVDELSKGRQTKILGARSVPKKLDPILHKNENLKNFGFWEKKWNIGKFIEESALPTTNIKQVVRATEGRWDYILHSVRIKLPNEIGKFSLRGGPSQTVGGHETMPPLVPPLLYKMYTTLRWHVIHIPPNVCQGENISCFHLETQGSTIQLVNTA